MVNKTMLQWLLDWGGPPSEHFLIFKTRGESPTFTPPMSPAASPVEDSWVAKTCPRVDLWCTVGREATANELTIPSSPNTLGYCTWDWLLGSKHLLSNNNSQAIYDHYSTWLVTIDHHQTITDHYSTISHHDQPLFSIIKSILNHCSPSWNHF